MRRVLILVAFLVLAGSAPAQAGQGLRVEQVPGERDGRSCPSVRVMNGDEVVWEVDFDDTAECHSLRKVLVHRGGIYFRLAWRPLHPTGAYGESSWAWWHTDGTTGDGTAAIPDESASDPGINDVRNPVLYRGRLYYFAFRGDDFGLRLWVAGPKKNPAIVRSFSPYLNLKGLRVADGLLRFRSTNGHVWRNWVSDGTRKGTHPVKR